VALCGRVSKLNRLLKFFAQFVAPPRLVSLRCRTPHLSSLPWAVAKNALGSKLSLACQRYALTGAISGPATASCSPSRQVERIELGCGKGIESQLEVPLRSLIRTGAP